MKFRKYPKIKVGSYCKVLRKDEYDEEDKGELVYCRVELLPGFFEDYCGVLRNGRNIYFNEKDVRAVALTKEQHLNRIFKNIRNFFNEV